MDDVFIFTEAYKCGLILKKAIDSFFKFHNQKVNIFGRPQDFKQLGRPNNNINFIDINHDPNIKKLYNQGHAGTAYIFANVIHGTYGNYKKVIHFDSDVIFRSECLSDILNKFQEGYHLIGPRRPYKMNKCNRDDVRSYADVSSTYFYGFDLEKVTTIDFNTLHGMIMGQNPILKHPVLDFFDSISFEILHNGGKIYFLDFDDYGSGNEDGNWLNSSGELNNMMDFGEKMIHFAGVGSGMNFYHNGDGNVPKTYTEWAKKRYSLYVKFMKQEVEVNYEYDKEVYNAIKKELSDEKSNS